MDEEVATDALEELAFLKKRMVVGGRGFGRGWEVAKERE